MKKQEMIVDHTKEKNKRKKVEEQSNHLGNLLLSSSRTCVHSWQAQPDKHHEGIINNIKLIQ